MLSNEENKIVKHLIWIFIFELCHFQFIKNDKPSMKANKQTGHAVECVNSRRARVHVTNRIVANKS